MTAADVVEIGQEVIVDGLRWEVADSYLTVGRTRVYRLSLLEECDLYPVGQVGFATARMMTVPA